MKDKSDIILGMIMLEDNTGFNIAGFTQDYDDNYKYAVKYQEGALKVLYAQLKAKILLLCKWGFLFLTRILRALVNMPTIGQPC